MWYFNNIFVCGYRAYLNKNTDPRFSEMLLVVACMGGYFGLVLGITKKVLGRDKALSLFQINFYVLIVMIFLLMFLTYKYYTVERINFLIQKYEQKSPLIRKTWGWITVLSIIIPYLTAGILLTNFNRG